MLESFNGGDRNNAIAREASCVIRIPGNRKGRLNRIIRESEQDIRNELRGHGLTASLTYHNIDQFEIGRSVLTRGVRDELIGALDKLPDGPIRMAKRPMKPVTVSNNIGVVRTKGGKIELETHLRTALNEKRWDRKVGGDIVDVLKKSDASIIDEMDYSGWQESESSPLVALAKRVIEEELEEEAHVFSYHAGLEVMVILERLKALGYDTDRVSCVALGPEINAAHSPHESVVISSIEKSYRVLKKIIEKLAE